jgi:hypothetical protein
MIARFFKDESGATAIEYGLIAAATGPGPGCCDAGHQDQAERYVHLDQLQDVISLIAAAGRRASAGSLIFREAPETAGDMPAVFVFLSGFARTWLSQA